MSRLRLTEYASKKLLFGEVYSGMSVTKQNHQPSLANLSTGDYVVKVDEGIKKRNKLDLVAIKVNKNNLGEIIEKYFSLGYSRLLIEKYLDHKISEEKYLSITLVREGFDVIYSVDGGVDVENAKNIIRYTFSPDDEIKMGLDKHLDLLVESLCEYMRSYHISFLEINPFIFDNGNTFIPLDMAVEIDSGNINRLPSWIDEHIISAKSSTKEEIEVCKINDNSTATFALKILNKDASIFTLLSGGGASLVVMDVLVDGGLQSEIGNYAEYSGGPSQNETKLFAKQILNLALNSSAKKKIFVIAGGVANFTDIDITLSGVTEALEEALGRIKKQSIFIFVRRGGPNQKAGLKKIKEFLDTNQIANIVCGPETSLTNTFRIVNDYLYDK